MSTSHHIIHIEPLAPRKPAVGAPCNGCGVCCLVAPCPLGVVLSGRRTGACVALRWHDGNAGLYRCGAIVEPRAVAANALPSSLSAVSVPLGFALGHLARRWVAAGVGCDSTVEVSHAGETMPHD
jgi:hypothetical protein